MSSEEEKDLTRPEIGSEIVYDKEPDDHDEVKSRENISTFKDISGFIGNFVWELFQTYKELLNTSPVRTKAISNATIALLGEIFSSYTISRAKKVPFSLNRSRLRAFAIYGFLTVGPVLHWWNKILERTVSRLGLSSHLHSIAKLALDRLLFAPPFMLFTVCILQYLQHFSVSKTIAYVKESYWKVLLVNEKVWTLAQVINYELIPHDYQDYFVKAVRLAWTTVLALAV